MSVWVWECSQCQAWHWAESDRGGYSVDQHSGPEAAEDGSMWVFDRGRPAFEYNGRPPAWFADLHPDHV